MNSNSIRNPNGIWINTNVFREEAIFFQRNGFYNSDPVGSPDWFAYWKEQRKRCIEGYTVAGVKITGYHYFYLNFCPIMKMDEGGKKLTNYKTRDFPNFWDGDYEYFWCREIARSGTVKSQVNNYTEYESYLELSETEQHKKDIEYLDRLKLVSKVKHNNLKGNLNMIVGKARRRGFSYKNASVGACNYFHFPGRITLYAAYEKNFLYPDATTIFPMTMFYINFINEFTAWTMPSDVINKVAAGHIRASYKEVVNGVELEKGFKSEIRAISCKDNPDALRGKDAYDEFFEESGAFGPPGLLKATISAAEDTTKQGIYRTGMITVFGTSGDIKSGTADYADMINNPERFDFLAFENIFEEKATNSIGFFSPVNWNFTGFMDEQGNSDKDSARNLVIKLREDKKAKGATAKQLNQMEQENPLSPSEAFGSTGSNIFPIQELKAQRDIVKNRGLNDLRGQNGKLSLDPSLGVIFNVDLKKNLTRIDSMTVNEDEIGCLTVYERPIENAPKGLYKIGYDPVRQDSGTSLVSYVVYKSNMKGVSNFYNDNIVAIYIGRNETNDDNHRIGELLAMWYNTQVMYENEVPDVKTYFQRRKLLSLLALQPDGVISKAVKKSTVSRIYGCHMTTQLRDAGEKYIKDWLLQICEYDEEGKPVMRLNKIYNLRLLDELIGYDRLQATRYDVISALIMAIFQVQEEYIDKEFEDKSDKNKGKSLLKAYKSLLGG